MLQSRRLRSTGWFMCISWTTRGSVVKLSRSSSSGGGVELVGQSPQALPDEIRRIWHPSQTPKGKYCKFWEALNFSTASSSCVDLLSIRGKNDILVTLQQCETEPRHEVCDSILSRAQVSQACWGVPTIQNALIPCRMHGSKASPFFFHSTSF